jgi:hypothetical protein
MLFNPRRTFYLQGFSARAATITIHHATGTSIEISGIFQSAEDCAVLGFCNAYDYFNHLRAKWLPRRDLSNLVLTFNPEMNSALEGNVRIDYPKYPAVAWNKITVASGAGVLYEAPLLPDNATIQAGDAARSLVQATLSGVAPL